jgi:hypothetical protein
MDSIIEAIEKTRQQVSDIPKFPLKKGLIEFLVFFI